MNRRLVASLFALFFFLFFTPLPAWANDDGTLTLAADTTLFSDHHGGIVIDADDITLDCAGFSIIGSGSGDGILLQGRTGVSVENCNVAGFTNGSSRWPLA